MTAQQEKYKVLLIGDACWDVYIFVNELRENPECSAPLLTEVGRLISGGMGMNTARCLKALGLAITEVFPREVSDKVRLIDNDSGTQYFRMDKDVNPDISVALEGYNLEDYDCIVISDYNKGFISTHTIKYIQDNYDGSIFLDTKKPNLEDFNKCFIKINTDESNKANMIPNGTVVTRGVYGAYLKNSFFDNQIFPSLAVECLDVCGAGDAFLAGYVHGYLKTGNINKAIVHGIVNSGLSVARRGTYAPNLQELEQGLEQYAKQCGES
jgi:bifunctional ADP-heptose synthase (sugar kinase/adenylyltransferase)